MRSSDDKVIAIISYITVIGWIVALILHNNNRSSLGAFHIRQSLGLFILAFIFWWIPFLGWALNIIIFVFIILGLLSAVQGEQKPVPLIGEYIQDILKGIN